ncbi:hypothetical protein CHS0354_002424 [Potamilus streckersoni]|uniref:C-type lectin domain-containing protein n=1 Tax=Potamilus streckersoni TaxID=2493646 RepID=A0AAE0W9W2_9BIVA|nr:hypothetical protein CHS0354_002424 [Potamilus streckersoni]
MAETQSENEWIKSEARKANHTAPEEGFWLGATDFIEEGHWYWESTQPFEFTYTDWGHLEPNNRFNRQHCLAILKFFDYHWGDEKCDWDNLNYICERRLVGTLLSIHRNTFSCLYFTLTFLIFEKCDLKHLHLVLLYKPVERL